MEQFLLGRPADEAACFLEKAGLVVRVVPYAAKKELPEANDARVMRCRIVENEAELIVCRFQTDILQEERQQE